MGDDVGMGLSVGDGEGDGDGDGDGDGEGDGDGDGMGVGVSLMLKSRVVTMPAEMLKVLDLSVYPVAEAVAMRPVPGFSFKKA